MHPPVPSPYAGADQPKVIYISAKTPFISAVKRVQKLLTLIEKRSSGKVDLINGKGNDKQKLKALDESTVIRKGEKPEEVLLKATNMAIDKALNLALFFQGQDDTRVRLRTGTISVVDDIIEGEETINGDKAEDQMEDEELPESQIRKLSVLEVAITRKEN